MTTLRTKLRDALDRLKPAAETLHDSVVGTAVEGSAVFDLVETALAEMRGDPRGSTALVLVTALPQLLYDAETAGLGDTAEWVACDIAVVEAQAAFDFVRAALVR